MTAFLDIRQRFADPVEAMQTAMDGRQAQMHTGMPGKIVSYNATTMTAVVQPLLQAFQTMPDGSTQPVTIAQVQDVPVHFPGGGGAILTFPVKVGDECWLKFSERSLDNWHQMGGVQQPSDWRMHDINDCVAEVGVRSQPAVPGNVSSTTTQLRTDDGTLVIDMDQPNGTTRITSPTQIILDTPIVTVTGVVNVTNTRGTAGTVGTFNGSLHATGEVMAMATGPSVTLSQHIHTDTHGDTTTPPEPGT